MLNVKIYPLHLAGQEKPIKALQKGKIESCRPGSGTGLTALAAGPIFQL